MKGCGNAEAEENIVMGEGIISLCACITLDLDLYPKHEIFPGGRMSLLVSCGRMCMAE